MPATSLTILEDSISFEPCWSTAESPREPRANTTEFGDGYQFVQKDGINNEPRVWNLSLEALTAIEHKSIDQFLKARGGHETFLFQPPGYEGEDPDTGITSRVKVRCPKRTPRYLTGGHVTMTMTFEERFI